MIGRSLARRLFVIAALAGTLTLLVAGIALVTTYRASAERSFDDRLAVHLDALVAALANQSDAAGTFQPPDDLGEARFERPLSGWYWVVRRAADGRVALASRSLVGEVLPLPSDAGLDLGRHRVSRAYLDGPDGQRLRVVERTVDFDGTGLWHLAVAGNAGELDGDVAAFRLRTALILGLVGLGVTLTVVLQVRLALAPLERMRRALHRIRAGETEHFEGEVPDEMAPFVHDLNALIDANRQAMDRARTHVGNLAHALKTPISVLTNEARAADGPLARHVVEQTALMREQVQHHLDRARIAAQRRVIGVVTEVAPVVERLVRAMRRIHEDKGLAVDLAVDPALRFRGEREDLEEALGNLVDNACKWARTRVRVAATLEAAAERGDSPRLVVLVDDDGPGLGPEERAHALQRGRRLDETVPGSGLGLAIVAELAALYGGALTLETAPLGGLRCRLVLPAL